MSNLHDTHSLQRASLFALFNAKKKTVHVAKRATRINRGLNFLAGVPRAFDNLILKARNVCARYRNILDLPHSLIPRRTQYPNITDVLICPRQFLHFDVPRATTSTLSALSGKFYNARANAEVQIRALKPNAYTFFEAYLCCLVLLISCFVTILLSYVMISSAFIIYDNEQML